MLHHCERKVRPADIFYWATPKPLWCYHTKIKSKCAFRLNQMTIYSNNAIKLHLSEGTVSQSVENF